MQRGALSGIGDKVCVLTEYLVLAHVLVEMSHRYPHKRANEWVCANWFHSISSRIAAAV